MSSSQRGKEDSKETVMCEHCSLKTRKDNLKRHTETQHPGSVVKWKRVVSQKSKLTDFYAKVNAEPSVVPAVQPDGDQQSPDLDDLEVDEDNNPITSDGEESKKRDLDDIENYQNKKQKIDTLGEDDEVEKGAFKQIQEVGLETLSKVDEIKKILENITTKDVKAKHTNDSVDKNNNIENQIDAFKKSLNTCTDIIVIEDFLEDSDFNVYPENGIIACKLCFGDSEPPSHPTIHPPGIINTLDLK